MDKHLFDQVYSTDTLMTQYRLETLQQILLSLESILVHCLHPKSEAKSFV